MRPIADIFGANKGSPPNLIADATAAFGEFIGMTVFIFLALSGVQAAIIAVSTPSSPTVDEIQSIAFSFASAITVALFICGPMSGGVLNPAVLLSLMLTGNINWLRGIFFFFAEMVGAIIGAYFANFVTANVLQGVNLLNPNFNYAQGFFAEMLLTMTLCLTVLFIIVDKTYLSDFAPFVVGTSVFICHMVGVPIDGTSINPARSFAASLVTGKWANHWIFWFGPLIGGLFATVIYYICKVVTSESQSQVLLQHAEAQENLQAAEAKNKMDPFSMSLNAEAGQPNSSHSPNMALNPRHDLAPSPIPGAGYSPTTSGAYNAQNPALNATGTI
jgi:MIP family channel proteins